MAWCRQATSHYLNQCWPRSPMPYGVTRPQWVKTHWPLGNLDENFRYLIFQIISVIDGWVIFCELALRWMSLKLTDDKSTLVQVMAWCRQATSHYLSQCWPRSQSPYGVTRPQWVNCDQATLRKVSSVRPSITSFAQCSCLCIIMTFSGVITIDKGDVHSKGQYQRSKVKVTEIKTNFAPIWVFSDPNSSLNSQMTAKSCTKLDVA